MQEMITVTHRVERTFVLENDIDLEPMKAYLVQHTEYTEVDMRFMDRTHIVYQFLIATGDFWKIDTDYLDDEEYFEQLIHSSRAADWGFTVFGNEAIQDILRRETSEDDNAA